MLLFFLYFAFDRTECEDGRIENRGPAWSWKGVLSNSIIATILVITVGSLTAWEYNCLDSDHSKLIKALVGGIVGHCCCCHELTIPKLVVILEQLFFFSESFLGKCPDLEASFNRLVLMALSGLICVCRSLIYSFRGAIVLKLRGKPSSQRMTSSGREDNDVRCCNVNLTSILVYTLLFDLVFLAVFWGAKNPLQESPEHDPWQSLLCKPRRCLTWNKNRCTYPKSFTSVINSLNSISFNWIIVSLGEGCEK
ncbi:hypothetical protein Droror1_Dr00015784 [Drosera rotundifolia]